MMTTVVKTNMQTTMKTAMERINTKMTPVITKLY